jgi:hypothetical protein
MLHLELLGNQINKFHNLKVTAASNTCVKGRLCARNWFEIREPVEHDRTLAGPMGKKVKIG